MKECLVTLNTLVQGAWALLLSRYSGRDEVMFGITVSGRPAELAGVEHIIGLFINTLPLRVAVPAAQSVGAWLRALQQHNLDLRRHEHTPLVAIQGWSEVARGEALFESLLVFENYPLDQGLSAQSKDLTASSVETRDRTNYPLTIGVAPGAGLELQLSYERARYEAGAVERVGRHLVHMLEQLAGDAEAFLGSVSWGVAEPAPAMARPEVPLPNVADWFAEQFARRPEAEAVICGTERISYAELQARAGRLSGCLRRQGVGIESRVGVCLERTPTMLVAVLAILQSGGAYVPLDPEQPTERLAEIIGDAGVMLVVTESEAIDVALSASGVRCLRVDREIDTGTTRPSERSWPILPEQLAYIIYTSGSSGMPKGVAVSHGALSRHIALWPARWNCGPRIAYCNLPH
ncbi:MAG: AMP-binding protein [Methylotetracoccus sp.]